MTSSTFHFTSPEADSALAELARRHQNSLTKPPGSLGRLEALAVQLAAWQGARLPAARPAAALIFAADHPVTAHGVSPYPSAVTRAMVHNILQGGAAASVLARLHDVPLELVDVGVDGLSEVPRATPHARYVRDPAAACPAFDLRSADALSYEGFTACVAAGRAAVERLGPALRVLVIGELGIGNTTVAAAVSAALVGGEPRGFVGPGTGATGALFETKCRVVEDAVARLEGERRPLEVLRRVGGRDVVGMFGAIVGALERRVLVLVDGYVATAAALAAVALDAAALGGLVFSHRSNEPAHARVLAHLGVEPLLDLGLRLGEASGALVAFPLLEQACALHATMATFESAGVPNREEPT